MSATGPLVLNACRDLPGMAPALTTTGGVAMSEPTQPDVTGDEHVEETDVPESETPEEEPDFDACGDETGT